MFRTSLLAAAFTVGCLSAASAAMIDFQAHHDRQVRGAAHHLDRQRRRAGDAGHRTKKLTYTMTYSGLTGPATAAHFHGPAAAGANAGVVVPIGTNPPSPTHRLGHADR